MADAIVEGATLVESGRIASLARQGLEDPSSLTNVQARQVYGAFLLLFDPLVRLRGEEAPPALIPVVRLPPAVTLAGGQPIAAGRGRLPAWRETLAETSSAAS